MDIQLIEEYKNRTEYKFLEGFSNCKIISLKMLKQGVLVIPGILLSRMKKEEIDILNAWVEEKYNQLILTPSWSEMNLKDYFNTSIDIIIKKTNGMFEEISIGYEIQTYVKDRLFFYNGKTYGINYRSNTTSGLITVVTIPLLDYKLIQFEDKFKELFGLLINETNYVAENDQMQSIDIEIDETHIFIVILVASGVVVNSNMNQKVYQYFRKKIESDLLQQKYNELILNEYIEDNKLTFKGDDLIRERNLKAFINIIKEKESVDDGWA